MKQQNEEKYLRALPVGYKVTVKDFAMGKDHSNAKFMHLRLCPAIKIEDGCDAMLVNFDVSVTVEDSMKDKKTSSWKAKLRLPYELLTCETIRVVDAISNVDAYES